MNWKPIETAPKDGTRILGYSPPWSEHGKGSIWICWFSKYTTKHWRKLGETKEAWIAGRGFYEPTHWMPLPDPPKERGAK